MTRGFIAAVLMLAAMPALAQTPAPAAAPAPQAPPAPPAPPLGGAPGGVEGGVKGGVLRKPGRESEDRGYSRGVRALDERQFDRAIEYFSEAARSGGSRADGALYWRAYAQNRLGQRTEALATLAELAKSFPSSRWLNDAKALEVEVRQASGQPVAPETESDDELKLYALNSLAHSDPERAVPMLEKLLQGTYPPKLKERALFVLSQSRSPKAMEILTQVARGKSNPDIQLKALMYLGMLGGSENRQILAEVYASSADVNLKRSILRSFMTARDRERLVAAAKSETVPELRREAIQQLGVLHAQDELWQLYASESSVEMKQQIIKVMFTAQNTEKLVELARTEKDPTLRREAVRMLGVLGPKRTGDVLPSLYASETDPAIRREVLNALYVQQNAKALIDIARKSTDLTVKKDIVQKLATMKTKEATDYMLEILNK